MSEQRLQGIEDRLSEVLAAQARTCALLEGLGERMDGRDRDAEEVRRMLLGDGNGHRGVVLRVDRLEQGAKRQQWFVRTLLAAVVASVVGAFRR